MIDLLRRLEEQHASMMEAITERRGAPDGDAGPIQIT
jgi:hypothetical protein